MFQLLKVCLNFALLGPVSTIIFDSCDHKGTEALMLLQFCIPCIVELDCTPFFVSVFFSVTIFLLVYSFHYVILTSLT